jgi:hypothetical protein
MESALERYMPPLMSQARILWERADYDAVEKLFRRSAEYCSANEAWTLNLAHTLFMQEKYKESADCYAPLVRKKFDRLMEVMDDAWKTWKCTRLVGLCSALVGPGSALVGPCSTLVRPCSALVGPSSALVGPCSALVGPVLP